MGEMEKSLERKTQTTEVSYEETDKLNETLWLKMLSSSQALVAHAFNPSTWEAEAGVALLK